MLNTENSALPDPIATGSTRPNLSGSFSDSPMLQGSDLVGAAKPSSSQPLAFIDSRVDDPETLINALENTIVYIIEPQQDGVAFISDTLSSLSERESRPSSLHIFAHGATGAMQLGSAALTADTLTGYSDELSTWSQSDTKDVLLYGCEIAKGAAGNAFIEQLAALTGADIQASNDLTGYGGDWDLEISVGAIESDLAINESAQLGYRGSLSSPIITSNGGGSTAALTVSEGESFITDVQVTGANGYFEGFGIEYYFSGGQDSYLFNIDVDTGELTFDGAFDFNNPTDTNRDNVYEINILAVDWTGASDTQAMSITVESEGGEDSGNSGGGLQIEGETSLSVDSGSTFVADLDVTGAANGFSEGNGVEYYFFGGQDSYLFNLDRNSGELSFANAPDAAAPADANRDNVYDVGILAIDYSGQQVSKSLTVTVQGSGDDDSGSGTQFGIVNDANISVDEGETFAADFEVTGVGSGLSEGSGVEYYFFGGQDSYLFDLNTDNGVLTFKNAPDFESPADANRDNVYDVGILAIDYAGGSESRSFAIALQDVNESSGSPVIISNGGGENAVIELNEGTTAVTDVNTTGANGFSEGNGLIYSLNAGDDADKFTIDPDTGVISFKATPDFENPTDTDGNNVYFANVLVQDPTGASDAQFLSVVVKDVTESGAAPTITSSGGGDSAFIQTPENDTFAVDMQATDADGETEGNGLTYRINAGEDADKFNIDAATGTISFKAAPDFENPTDSDSNNIYRINVLAEDSTGLADSQFIQIEVTNKVAVYLLGGQSNMAGATSDASFLAGTPQGNPLPDVQIWNGGFNSFTALRPGFNGNFGTGDGFGAEIGFGHALEAARDSGSFDSEEIYLIKYAIGATSLAVDWNVNQSGPVYSQFTQWVDDALAKLTSDGIGYDVEGMLWMQGENDAIEVSAATSYETNLNNLIADVHRRYDANMDFVIGRLHEELTPFFYTEADTVRQAQVSVANADPRNFWVNTDDFVVNPVDGVHFDSSGHLALGEAFADVILS